MKKVLSCAFNMDSGCVELKFSDGSMISINCTAVENELADKMYERSELDTVLKADPNFESKVNFTEQHVYRKKYYKSKVKEIYADDGFEEIEDLGELPEDTSVVFFVLKKKATRAVYFNCNGGGANTYIEHLYASELQ